MARTNSDTNWIKAHISDELGLTANDLAGLYGIDVAALDSHLVTLGRDVQSISQRILSDIDAVRVGYRRVEVSDDHISAIRDLLASYLFHPLVSTLTASGDIGWRLSGDDAQWVAFRTADVVGMAFGWDETLRVRLNRLVLWPDAKMPDTNQAFRDRLADVTFYLTELTEVL
ncbi:MAG: hypothetical protein ABI947_07575 [Chloroflexota bacterium]